jgi:integrase
MRLRAGELLRPFCSISLASPARGGSAQCLWNGARRSDFPCHAHGLRKTFNTIAAEAGCTPHELMTLSGHQTLGEVTRYTAAAADRKKLAAEGMKKIEMRTARGNPD